MIIATPLRTPHALTVVAAATAAPIPGLSDDCAKVVRQALADARSGAEVGGTSAWLATHRSEGTTDASGLPSAFAALAAFTRADSAVRVATSLLQAADLRIEQQATVQRLRDSTALIVDIESDIQRGVTLLSRGSVAQAQPLLDGVRTKMRPWLTAVGDVMATLAR